MAFEFPSTITARKEKKKADEKRKEKEKEKKFRKAVEPVFKKKRRYEKRISNGSIRGCSYKRG